MQYYSINCRLLSYDNLIFHSYKNCIYNNKKGFHLFFDLVLSTKDMNCECFDNLNTCNDIRRSETLNKLGKKKTLIIIKRKWCKTYAKISVKFVYILHKC